MTKFTKEVLQTMRASMLKEMSEVAKKYGVTAEFGNIRFSPDEFGVKMTVRRNGFEKPVPVVTNTSGGKVEIGTVIKHPARKDPLVVENINGKYVHIVSNRGAKYRIKMADAIKYAA